MANLSSFNFPSVKKPESLDTTQPTRKERPYIQLNINTEVGGEYQPAILARSCSRPAILRTITPPESPIRTRSATMASKASSKTRDSGVMTPPLTPTGSRHAKSSSTSSDFLASISGLRRGDSLSSSAGRLSIDDSARPGSTELLAFPHHLIDYQIQTDGDGSKRPIGCGAWGDVYLAQPSLPQQSDQPLVIPCGSSMSPPITPVRSRGSSIGTSILPSMPSRYAIKVPGSASAKKVLTAEARILSYLSQFPDADNHVVPFYGQDTRTGALVLKALDGTLDVWIETHLNTLDEPNRAQKLASIFPTIALSLIDSLTWMQSKDCTHADIKPANILTSASTSSSITPTLIFSDFSSSILTALATDDATPPPMGAGTWDFLDPSLLSFFNTPAPSAATDLWSLGITLLFLVLGTSPFDAFKQNKFQQREMIKSGTPLQCMAYDDQGIVNMRRMKGLSRDLGFDVSRWFAKVLVKSAEKRVSVGVWREELVGSLESGKRM